jgi:hypothetical protein
MALALARADHFYISVILREGRFLQCYRPPGTGRGGRVEQAQPEGIEAHGVRVALEEAYPHRPAAVARQPLHDSVVLVRHAVHLVRVRVRARL